MSNIPNNPSTKICGFAIPKQDLFAQLVAYIMIISNNPQESFEYYSYYSQSHLLKHHNSQETFFSFLKTEPGGYKILIISESWWSWWLQNSYAWSWWRIPPFWECGLCALWKFWTGWILVSFHLEARCVFPPFRTAVMSVCNLMVVISCIVFFFRGGLTIFSKHHLSTSFLPFSRNKDKLRYHLLITFPSKQNAKPRYIILFYLPDYSPTESQKRKNRAAQFQT